MELGEGDPAMAQRPFVLSRAYLGGMVAAFGLVLAFASPAAARLVTAPPVRGASPSALPDLLVSAVSAPPAVRAQTTSLRLTSTG
jgi:hypothetical protein